MARKNKRKRHIGFNGLAARVTREYEKRGYSRQQATRIGRATAGKVAREKGKR